MLVALPADVTDHHAVVEVVAAAESQLGPIDVLINGAGSFRALGNAAQVDPDEWWREVEINFRGPFVCAHAVLPGMIARRRGRIINIVSAAGLQAIETVSAYGVSKAALIRFTEALAAETQPYGIAVLAAHPGTVRTPMSEYAATSPQIQERAPLVQQWFQQLFAEGGDTPMEQAVAFMLAVASGQADALSGCYLSVDDDLEALVTQAEAIQSEALLRLRFVPSAAHDPVYLAAPGVSCRTACIRQFLALCSTSSRPNASISGGTNIANSAADLQCARRCYRCQRRASLISSPRH